MHQRKIKMYKKLLILAFVTVFFLVGAYTWKIANTGHNLSGVTVLKPEAVTLGQGVLVAVDGEPISRWDVDLEYRLLTKGLTEETELKPVPELEKSYTQELDTLRERILDSLIERKLLYRFVNLDKTFDISSAARYDACVQEWQKAVVRIDVPKPQESKARAKLKEWICERSIVRQYIDERINPKISVSKDEIAAHYKKNHGEFRHPEEVQIRQIVLTNEDSAKEIRAKVNPANFSQLAKVYSITPEAINGGRLPAFARGKLPQFFNIAFSMNEGQISDILKSTYGFHIIIVDKKLNPRILSLAEVTPQITKILLSKKREQEYEKWVDLALQTIKVNTPTHF